MLKRLDLNPLLKSLSDDTDPEGLIKWVRDKRENHTYRSERIAFKDTNSWYFNEASNLVHASRGFFTIHGVRIYDIIRNRTFYQPIINQNEHGILGILVQKHAGVYKFLLQAKIEPGNACHIQLSPTVQATESNFKKKHKGAVPMYLSYFKEEGTGYGIIAEQLQSEHGYKFKGKANRNILVEVDEDLHVELHDNFRWFTLSEIAKGLCQENIINMDTRSVLSIIPFHMSMGDNHENNPIFNSLLFNDPGSFAGLRRWIQTHKAIKRFEVLDCNLDEICNHGWNLTDTCLSSEDCQDFRVIMLKVWADREVACWEQPIVEDMNEKLCGMICTVFKGVLYILIQICNEACSYSGAEVGPSLHNYHHGAPETDKRFLDYFVGENGKVIYNKLQSEEGGRFYHMVNRYAVSFVDDMFDVNDNFRWVSLAEVKEMMKEPCFVNIEARTLVACIQGLREELIS